MTLHDSNVVRSTCTFERLKVHFTRAIKSRVASAERSSPSFRNLKPTTIASIFWNTSWHRSRISSVVSRAPKEYRQAFALMRVDCNCFRTEQKRIISIPICLTSCPAEPTVDANSNNTIDSLAPAPATPIMLAIVPIASIEDWTRNLGFEGLELDVIKGCQGGANYL